MPGRHPHISRCLPLDWTAGLDDVVRAWPADLPLIALTSGAGGEPGGGTHTGGGSVQTNATRWSRWSILAAAIETVIHPVGASAIDLLDAASARRTKRHHPDIPFVGGWIGSIGYELAAAIEPTAITAQRHDPRQASTSEREANGVKAVSPAPPPEVITRKGPWSTDPERPKLPARHTGIELARCPGAFVHDGLNGKWYAVGDTTALPHIHPRAGSALTAAADTWTAGPLRSRTGREAYEHAVARVVELIHAGDIFQANIAHQLAASFEGSHRALFLDLLAATRPWYGSLIEGTGKGAGAILSTSPELFLDIDFISSSITTRPIKGTRPLAQADELAASEKDAAELVMIVDLMRNDLGRVCSYGSVRVEEPRRIERHAGVAHGVATISGRLRDHVGLGDIIRATFPPGSVTGAPKVRAMQVINQFEPFARGAYCGAIGFISFCGRSAWNVAIRTATIDDGELVYPVGAGIVADSDPAKEWEETLAKASAFARVLNRTREAAVV